MDEEAPPRGMGLPEGLELRPAREEEARDLAELWSYAFPGERSVDERVQELDEGGTYGGLETAWVCQGEEGRLGALRMYELTLHLWGRAYRAMGLAAVAVEPGARRRGVGRWMCERALERARTGGSVLSLLYPYRVSFYSRLGYTLAGELHRYRFSPAELPLFAERAHVERADSSAAVEKVRALYDRVARESNGLLVRPPGAWEFLEGGGTVTCLFRNSEGGAEGYMVVEPARRMRHGRRELRVREVVAESADGYRGLLGWLSAQRGQWDRLVYDALPGEGLHRVLSHPERPGAPRTRGLWFESARILRGPMLRILDVEALLGGGEGVNGDGALLAVRDPQIPDNEGVWRAGTQGARKVQDKPGDGALPVSLATDLLVAGSLPGVPSPPEGWTPPLGVRDFRVLDSF